jgi:Bacterial Ig-like domain (group 3)
MPHHMPQGSCKRPVLAQPLRSLRLLLRVAIAVLLALCVGALASTTAGAAAFTVTRLGSTNNPSSYGQPVIFIAAVLAESSAGTPTGTVAFTDGTNVLGNISLDSDGRATFTTSSLAAGSHSIAATYMPADPLLFSGSSATLTQNVTSTSTSTITTTVTLTSRPNPSTFGQPVTFAATVKGNGGTPAGTVVFADGATALGTASLDNNGQATFITSTLTVGSHAIAANYRGDPNFPSSSTTLTQTVNPKKTGTTTALKASKNPSKSGESVTFMASVTPGGGSGLATGTVTFMDGSTALGTEPLNKSGRIAFATSRLAVGRHLIVANYDGDADFAGSQSNALVQTVHQ